MRRGASLVTCLRSHGHSLSVWGFAPSSSGHIMQLVSPPKMWLGYWCISGRRMFSIFERWASVLGAYTETSKVGGAPGRVRMAAASSPCASSPGRGVMKRESRGEQTKTDQCSPLEFLSWLMFETMVALVPEP